MKKLNSTKKKRIVFLRQDAHKKNKLSKKWRKPKGSDSKMRLRFKGHRKSPTPGYGTNKKLKYTISGLKEVLVKNPTDLQNINNKTQVLTIARTVGLKKRLQILEKAKSLNFKILNIKNIDAYIQKVKENISKRKELKQKKTKEKEQSKKELEKKAEEKEKQKSEEIKEETTEEEKLKEKKSVPRDQPKDLKQLLPKREKSLPKHPRLKIIGDKK